MSSLIPPTKSPGDVIRSSEWNFVLEVLRSLFAKVAKTADYTATLDDFLILVDDSGGSVVITLPAATNTGKEFLVVKSVSSANTVTVQCTGADKIEGSASVTLSAQYDKIHVIADGTATYDKLGGGAGGSGVLAVDLDGTGKGSFGEINFKHGGMLDLSSTTNELSRGELDLTIHARPDYYAEATVDNTVDATSIIFGLDGSLWFGYLAISDVSYDGTTLIQLLAQDGTTWITIATLTGTTLFWRGGVPADSTGSASDLSTFPQFPYVIQVIVSVKATVGSLAVKFGWSDAGVS